MSNKIIIPFHMGQKVHIGKPDYPTALDYNCDAIVYEVNYFGYDASYSLITIDINNKVTGGGAWYPHNILTLVEDVNKKNLKILLDEQNKE